MASSIYNSSINNSHFGPTLVIDQLWTCIDAANPKCFSGTPADGNTVYDLSGNGRNWTINKDSNGNITHGTDSIADTKVFTITKSTSNNIGDQNRIVSPIVNTDPYMSDRNNSNVNYTLMVGSRYTTSTNRNRVFSDISDASRPPDNQPVNWFLGHQGNTTGRCFTGGWIGSSSGEGDIGINDWAIYTTTRRGSDDEQDFWINGTKEVSNSSAGMLGPYIMSIGGGWTGSEYSDCAVSFALLYTKSLTDVEILQNYNVFKGRFGL